MGLGIFPGFSGVVLDSELRESSTMLEVLLKLQALASICFCASELEHLMLVRLSLCMLSGEGSTDGHPFHATVLVSAPGQRCEVSRGKGCSLISYLLLSYALIS